MNIYVILQVDVLAAFYTTTYSASFIVYTISYKLTFCVCYCL